MTQPSPQLPAGRWFAPGDAMRVLGAVAVVVIHVASEPVADFGRIARLDWWLSAAAYTACRWAVPLFIMLSGALLLDPSKDEPIGVFYRRRLWRVGVPTVVWSALYLWWRAWYQGKPTDLDYILGSLAAGAPYAHLYFLYLLTGLYLVTPFLRLFLRQADRRQQLAALLVAFGIGMGDKLVRCWFGGGVNVCWMFVPYLGYYLAGWWLRGLAITERQARLAGWIWLVSVPVTMLAMRFSFGQREQMGMRYWPTEYLSPAIVTMSLAAFVYLSYRYLALRPQPVLQSLGDTMLGVYLIHPALLNVMRDFGLTATWHGAAIGIPVSTLVALCSAYLICVLLKAGPGLRAVVGG